MVGVYVCSEVYHETFFCKFTTIIIFVVEKYTRAAMQHRLLYRGAARTSAGLQAATSPGWSAETGARAAKREVRVVARGRASSHATRRSILMAAAIATCCRWVFAVPQYRVRRSPKARTPCASVPSMPARCAYCALPSALAYQALASATAAASARGGSPSRRPRCVARVHAARDRARRT